MADTKALEAFAARRAVSSPAPSTINQLHDSLVVSVKKGLTGRIRPFRRVHSQPASLPFSVFPQRFFGTEVKPPGCRILFDVVVPEPCPNLRDFLIAELFNGIFNFLDGAHSTTENDSANRSGDSDREQGSERAAWRLTGITGVIG